MKAAIVLCASAILLSCPTPAASQTPDGYQQQHGVCHKKENVHYECPRGYTYDDESLKCIKHDHMEPYTYCPKGTKETADGCVKYVYQKKTPYCEHGKLEGHKCIHRKYTDAEYQCKDGYSFTHDKSKCFADKYTAKLHKCPGGYELTKDKKNCIKHIYADLKYYCPKHSYATAKGCKVTTYEAKVPYCHQGYLEGGKCVVIKHSYHSYYPKCKQGYSFRRHKCVLESYHDARYKCPRGFAFTDDQSKCYVDKYVAKLRECPHGYKWSRHDSKCVRYEYADLKYYCPKHSVLTHKGCKSTIYEAKAPYCTHGNLEGDHKCVVEEAFLVDYECPDGYQLTKDSSKCYAKTFVDIKYSCVDGYKLSEEKDKCVKALYADVAHKCLKGKLTLIAGSSGYAPVCCIDLYYVGNGSKSIRGGNTFH